MPSPQRASGSQQSISNIDSITAHDRENLKAPLYSDRDKLDGSKNYVAWAFRWSDSFRRIKFGLNSYVRILSTQMIPLTAEV
ncbi:unnamed protein product [Calypogeia fissa]